MKIHFPALPLAVALVAATSLAVACGGDSPQQAGSGVRVTAADRAAAQKEFDTLCWTCHGKTGHGDGPASTNLDPKPRSFSDKAWQASVDDAHIAKVITLGGAAVGKSAIMPPSPQLKSQPGVVQALVEIVRSQGR